jgi:hypothetical protein
MACFITIGEIQNLAESKTPAVTPGALAKFSDFPVIKQFHRNVL